jgi:hypothetical protein
MRQVRDLLIRANVPEAHVSAQRTSSDQAAVRAVGDPIALFVSGQDFDLGEGRHVPEPDRPIIISHAGELSAVGAESHIEGAIPMPLEDAGRLPRGNIPEPHGAISTPRGQQRARRIENRSGVTLPVAGRCGENLAGLAGR